MIDFIFVYTSSYVSPSMIPENNIFCWRAINFGSSASEIDMAKINAYSEVNEYMKKLCLTRNTGHEW